MGTVYDAVVADSYPTSETTPDAMKYYSYECHRPEFSGLDCVEVAGLESIASKASVSVPASFASTLLTVTDTATVAARSSGTALERTVVSPKPGKATCNTVVEADISVTKTCPQGAYLVVKNGVLVVEVTIQGTVTNTSLDSDVWIIGLLTRPRVGWLRAYRSSSVAKTFNFGPFCKTQGPLTRWTATSGNPKPARRASRTS